MKFCVSDGRAWYKQVVSGALMMVPIIMLSLFVFVEVFVVVEAGSIAELKMMAFIIAFFVLVLAAIIAYAWAKEDL